jgi:hypothetical protein
MKKPIWIVAGIAAVALATYLVLGRGSDSTLSDIVTTVKSGTFRVEVETTGELEAKNSVKIQGPQSLRNFQIWQVTIQRIVDEGTVVKKGDWVATLDRSEFQNKFTAKQIELDKASSKYTQTELDTTLQLRQARDELINLKYAVDERQIILEQSQFEPPASCEMFAASKARCLESAGLALRYSWKPSWCARASGVRRSSWVLSPAILRFSISTFVKGRCFPRTSSGSVPQYASSGAPSARAFLPPRIRWAKPSK